MSKTITTVLVLAVTIFAVNIGLQRLFQTVQPSKAAQAVQKVGQASPLYQENASTQAAKLAALIQDRPECQVFKGRLMEAGKGSPYAGSTQMALTSAYEAAKKAGCRVAP